MNFYKHHIGDYRRDTTHLTLLEHGAYRQLLDTYYLNEEPIQLDLDQVCRKLLARTPDERAAVETVLSEFFEKTERGYIHSRCEVEIEEYRARAEVAKANGTRGGRPKKTESVSAGFQEKTHDETGSKPNHEPVTKNQKPTKAAPVDVGLFDGFWSAYPRKVAKPEALKAWLKIKPGDELAATIIAAVNRAKQSRDWTKDDGQFIPHPSTWLNQHRWEDEAVSASEPEDHFGGLL